MNTAALVSANTHRSTLAARQVCDRVRATLEQHGDTVPANVPPSVWGKLVAAGQLRIAHPTDTLRQLAERAGTTKHTVASRLRRLLLHGNQARSDTDRRH